MIMLKPRKFRRLTVKDLETFFIKKVTFELLFWNYDFVIFVKDWWVQVWTYSHHFTPSNPPMVTWHYHMSDLAYLARTHLI